MSCSWYLQEHCGLVVFCQDVGVEDTQTREDLCQVSLCSQTSWSRTCCVKSCVLYSCVKSCVLYSCVKSCVSYSCVYHGLVSCTLVSITDLCRLCTKLVISLYIFSLDLYEQLFNLKAMYFLFWSQVLKISNLFFFHSFITSFISIISSLFFFYIVVITSAVNKISSLYFFTLWSQLLKIFDHNLSKYFLSLIPSF